MKYLLLAAILTTAPMVAEASFVNLELTGSWGSSDFDVSSSSGPSAPEDDDLVFGIAPSDGSVSVNLLVDTSDVVSFTTGDFGVTHDWFGYSTVSLAQDVTLGDALWDMATTPLNLEGPNGEQAYLWTDTDLTMGDPTLLSFRMFGTWTTGADSGNADMFFGSRTATTIGTQFLTWEYFEGEEIRSANYSASVSPVPLPAPALMLIAGLGGLMGLKRRKAA